MRAEPGQFAVPAREVKARLIDKADQNQRLEVWLARRRELAAATSPTPWSVSVGLRGAMLMDANGQVVRFNRKTCEMVAAAVNVAMSIDGRKP